MYFDAAAICPLRQSFVFESISLNTVPPQAFAVPPAVAARPKPTAAPANPAAPAGG